MTEPTVQAGGTARWLRGEIRSPADGRPPSRTVVKIGGSLLDRPAWPAEIASLLTAFPGPLLVVGGGRIVDGLRAIDAASPRPSLLMHELAIDAMALSGRIVAAALRLPVVARADEPGVLDVGAWLRDADPVVSLPVGWHVTSDSIAAVVARRLAATLLLAKSVPPPARGRDTLESLAAAGWVDSHFPTAAGSLAGIDWAAPA